MDAKQDGDDQHHDVESTAEIDEYQGVLGHFEAIVRVIDKVCAKDDADDANAQENFIEELDQVVNSILHRLCQVKRAHSKHRSVGNQNLEDGVLTQDYHGEGKKHAAQAEVEIEAQCMSVEMIYVGVNRLILFLEPVLIELFKVLLEESMAEDREKEQTDQHSEPHKERYCVFGCIELSLLQSIEGVLTEEEVADEDAAEDRAEHQLRLDLPNDRLATLAALCLAHAPAEQEQGDKEGEEDQSQNHKEDLHDDV